MNVPALNLWTSYLTPSQETLYQQTEFFWDLAQRTTIVAGACLGALVIASPWITPLSYTELVMQIFSWAPIFLPVPFYIYTYFGSQIERARSIAEKILFLRDYSPKITENPSLTERSLLDTFEGHLSLETKQSLLQAKELHPLVISHIDFLTKKIERWEEEKKPLTSPLSHMQKEFDILLSSPLLAPWHQLMLEKKREWISNSTFELPEGLLQQIIEEIKNRSSYQEILLKSQKISNDPTLSDDKKLIALADLEEKIKNSQKQQENALAYLEEIYWKWHNQPALSFEKKWGSLFDLEEKILEAQMQRIFLWSLLLCPERVVLELLQRHQVEIEKGLLSVVKKREITFAELSIAEKCHDELGQKIYLLESEKAITREDLRKPNKREEILHKLVRAHAVKSALATPKDV